MGILTLLAVLVVFLFFYFCLKRSIIKRALRFVIACMALLAVLMAAWSFISNSEDGLLAKAGAVVFDKFKGSLANDDVEEFLNTTEIVDKSAELIEEKFINK